MTYSVGKLLILASFLGSNLSATEKFTVKKQPRFPLASSIFSPDYPTRLLFSLLWVHYFYLPPPAPPKPSGQHLKRVPPCDDLFALN